MELPRSGPQRGELAAAMLVNLIGELVALRKRASLKP
jgi:hypothetical protein